MVGKRQLWTQTFLSFKLIPALCLGACHLALLHRETLVHLEGCELSSPVKCDLPGKRHLIMPDVLDMSFAYKPFNLRWE